MREHLIYMMLATLKGFSRLLYRFDIAWIGTKPTDPWSNIRLVLFLNHTSLYEPLFAGWVPNRFLRNLARKGVVPVADKTARRPLVGLFYKLVAHNVVSVSRKRDDTWKQFVAAAGPDSMVVMAPEGRMKRRNGLDVHGLPMTIRGGFADLLEKLSAGRMLIAYSGGLHHVQYPTQWLPKIFKTLRMRVESLDITYYKEMILQKCNSLSFKQALIADLQNRLERYCPVS